MSIFTSRPEIILISIWCLKKLKLGIVQWRFILDDDREASSHDQINMTKYLLEFDRKISQQWTSTIEHDRKICRNIKKSKNYWQISFAYLRVWGLKKIYISREQQYHTFAVWMLVVVGLVSEVCSIGLLDVVVLGWV